MNAKSIPDKSSQQPLFLSCFSFFRWSNGAWLFIFSFFELLYHLFRISSPRLFIHSVSLELKRRKGKEHATTNMAGSQKRENKKKGQRPFIYLIILSKAIMSKYHLYQSPAYSYSWINLASFIARRMARTGNISAHYSSHLFSIKRDAVNKNYSLLISLIFFFG